MADDSIGALWLKDGAKGKYMSGEVTVGGTKQRIVVFRNTYKQDEKHPDYRILASKPKGGEQSKQDDFQDDTIPF